MTERTLWGVPRSLKRGLVSLFSGTIGDVLWKLLLVVLFTVVGIALLSMGPAGALLGGLLIGTLLSDDVRQLVSDLWHRRWAEVESPL